MFDSPVRTASASLALIACLWRLSVLLCPHTSHLAQHPTADNRCSLNIYRWHLPQPSLYSDISSRAELRHLPRFSAHAQHQIIHYTLPISISPQIEFYRQVIVALRIEISLLVVMILFSWDFTFTKLFDNFHLNFWFVMRDIWLYERLKQYNAYFYAVICARFTIENISQINVELRDGIFRESNYCIHLSAGSKYYYNSNQYYYYNSSIIVTNVFLLPKYT